MKKVVIIGSAHPLRGGLATYNERLARALQSEGNEVEIFTFSLQYPSFLFPGKTQYSDEPAPEGIDISACINSINPLNWISIGRKIKKQKPDLVIIPYWLPFMAPSLGTIAKIIRLNGHSRIISIVHNVVPHERTALDRFLSGYFVKNVDGFAVMSEAVLKELELFDTTKPKSFSPHPLYDNFGKIKDKQEAKKSLGLDEKTNYILFFGFIREYKGLDLLIEAFADERLRQFPLKLIIAGEYYVNPELYHKLIKKYQLENYIIHKEDFIPDDEVADYFCAADIVAQPYKTATQSGVTQIAYHFNKPMLVTNVGGLAEIIPHNKVGYVVEPDKKAIGDALLDFYENKREGFFTENAMEEKKKYSWKNMVDNIERIYRLIKEK